MERRRGAEWGRRPPPGAPAGKPNEAEPMKAASRTVRLKWVHTSDMHGQLFPWDFVEQREAPGGLSRAFAYVEELRRRTGAEHVVLTDGGDILQGGPTAYYAQHIDTEATHWMGDAMNRMRYDAACVGNHDLGAGHAVYDKWVSQCRFPVLGANVLDALSREPYFRPYAMLERSGLRIAVLGLLTPVVPYWLPRTLWSGLAFEDMLTCARRWVRRIRERERPHLLVGLFHAGRQGGIVTAGLAENATMTVAREVDGFDLICYGHDHLPHMETLRNAGGHDVLCMAPSYMGISLCEADVELVMQGDEVKEKRLAGRLVDLSGGTDDACARSFEQRYAQRRRGLEAFVNRPLGHIERRLRCRDAYFGPSGFIDLIHRVQLWATDAQISLAAPVTFDAEVDRGTARVSDTFKIYRYEDLLYTLLLTGREIQGVLEMSYALWTQQMRRPEDHIMRLAPVLDGGRRMSFRNLAFDFETAAGIRYTVDVTQPDGGKVHIEQMADGKPFRPEAYYRVVTNAHRGNGGGELLTRGAGIPQEELERRRVGCTERELRHYIMEYIRQEGHVDGLPLNHWRFVPEEWAVPACRRDRALLFGD